MIESRLRYRIAHAVKKELSERLKQKKETSKNCSRKEDGMCVHEEHAQGFYSLFIQGHNLQTFVTW